MVKPDDETKELTPLSESVGEMAEAAGDIASVAKRAIENLVELGKRNEQRKFLLIDDRDILSAFCAISRGQPAPQILGLPEDVEVLGVYYNARRRGMEFILCSSRWPVVKEGEELKEADVEIVRPPIGENQMVLWEELGSSPDRKSESVPISEMKKRLREKLDARRK